MAKIVTRDKKGNIISTTDTKTGKTTTRRETTERQKRDAEAIQRGVKERKKEKETGRVQPPTKTTVLPTIDLRPEKTGIQKFAETKAGKILTSPKTTIGLALTLAGGVGLAAKGGLTVRGLLTGKALRTTQVARAAQVGGPVVESELSIIARGGTIARVLSNPKKAKLTTKILVGLGFTVAGAALAKDVIGTYPFAGFLKEEALQTISFGVRSAILNGDVEGAERAIALQEEILNNDLTKIPYLNVQEALREFNAAAAAKLEIDRKVVADLKIQQETGETNDEKFARIRKEEAEQDRLTVDYYNDQRKLMLEFEREAERNARNEDAAFWRREQEKQREKEAEDREAIAEFWEAFRRRIQEINEDSRPSKLNFGLI